MLIKSNNINDSEIFRKYFGEFQIGKKYPSKFRSDENPSTGFFINNKGKIIYNDFTTGEKLSAIEFVIKLFGISYQEALKKINNDYQLGEFPKVSFEKKQKEKIEIYVLPKDFDKRELAYFNTYNISQQELEENDVYSVKSIFLKDKIIRYFDNKMHFAYRLLDKDEVFFKIYSPNSNDTYKWISNIPLSKPFGLNTLPRKSKRLIVTKSLKDKIVLNKFFTDVIALQNESPASFPQELINNLLKDYDEILINFDADNPGKRAALYYLGEYGFDNFSIPNDIYLKHNIKDYSDFIQKFGIEKCKKLLEWQKLI